MAFQARALYDFDGDAGGGELSFGAGDVLTIINDSVGDGWWEAKISNGNQGYVPSAYLEVMEAPEPSLPAPPLPARPIEPVFAQPALPQNNWSSQPQNNWSAQPTPWDNPPAAARQSSQTPQQSVGGAYDNARDEWDDWDSDEDPPQSRVGNYAAQADRDSVASDNFQFQKVETTRRGIGKFSSTFVKVGGEAFILGTSSVSEPSDQLITITVTSDGPQWLPVAEPFTVTISTPHKESKFKGIKSFIAYQVTPSFSNIQVTRRYKHFDWLHERLEAKFLPVNVPPLPDKQVSGRFEDEFVQQRMFQLQTWLDRMAKHPVVSASAIFRMFLTCTDEKQWKKAKRAAERDQFTGGRVFLAITPPENTSLDLADTDKQVEHFAMFLKTFENSAKTMVQVFTTHQRVCGTNWKREYEKMGQAFLGLANAFRSDHSTSPASKVLAGKFESVGKTYDALGTLLETKVVRDLSTYLCFLNEYKGLAATMPHVTHIHRGASTTIANLNRTDASDQDIQESAKRAETLSWAVLAEMNHFHAQRVTDFKTQTRKFIQDQIDFYRNAAAELQTAIDHFDS